MTPIEARKFCREFEAVIGGRAKVWMSISGKQHEAALDVLIYTQWPGREADIRFTADDFDEACARVRSEWDKHKADITADKIKRLAIEIIKITDAKGVCMEADLRCLYYFSDADVSELGAAAVEAANRMAGRGPFSIVKTPGGNGAPAVDEETP